MAFAVDVPDVERFAGQLALVDDCAWVDRSKTSLEIGGPLGTIVEEYPGEICKDIVGRGVDDEDRPHAGSVVGSAATRQTGLLVPPCGDVAFRAARAGRKVRRTAWIVAAMPAANSEGGSGGRIRTTDQGLMSPLLYH